MAFSVEHRATDLSWSSQSLPSGALIHGTIVECGHYCNGLAAAATTNQHKHTYTDDNDETNEQRLNRGQYMVVILVSVLLVIRKILVANGSTNDALD